MNIKKWLLMGTLISCMSNSYAMVVYDPFDVIQNTISAHNSVKELINQVKSLENDFKNLTKLPQFHDFKTANNIEELSSMSQKSSPLGYAANDIDKVLPKIFPGTNETGNFLAQFIERSNAVRDSVQGSYKGLALQSKYLLKEQEDVNGLENLSNHCDGNLQAQQLNHRIGLQQIAQTQKLRQLLLNQASSQEAFIAYEVQKDQSNLSAIHSWLENSQTPFKRYNDREGFGADDLPVIN